MRNRSIVYLCLCLLGVSVFFENTAYGQTVFTVRSGESKADRRMDYPQELLRLALEKTVPTYGSFKLVKAPVGANMKRSLQDLHQNKYENFFVRQSASDDNLKGLVYIPFPIDLGIVGYRLAFTSLRGQSQMRSVKSIKELRPFTIVQGVGWLDTKIFRSYGLKVQTNIPYESMFKVVASGRADLFFRGANEVLDEWEERKHIPGLVLDDAIVVYYPLPRFFITRYGNEKAAKRVHDGLILAYEDGSLKKLWDKYYGASIDFAKLGKRKVFSLENPYLAGVDPTFKKYIYNPYIK